MTMKILLAGAFGKLGSEILRALCATDNEIVAADAVLRIPEDMDQSRFETKKIDVTDLCDGVDIVITTVGLTTASTRFSNYDIDFHGNLNLLNEAKKAGVKQFDYISVINADKGDKVPMVNSKFLLEQDLKKSVCHLSSYRIFL